MMPVPRRCPLQAGPNGMPLGTGTATRGGRRALYPRRHTRPGSVDTGCVARRRRLVVVMAAHGVTASARALRADRAPPSLGETPVRVHWNPP